MTVSSLQKTSSEHVTIVWEECEPLKSTLGVVAEFRLFPGGVVSHEIFQQIRQRSSVALWREKALEMISRRQYSARELSLKLEQKGASPEEASEVVQWLTEHRYIDDAQYASAVVRHYSSKGYGLGRIRSEFSRRGIPREYWQDALSESSDPADTLDSLLAKKLKDPADRQQVQKAASFLYRRGYSWNDIQSSIERMKHDENNH